VFLYRVFLWLIAQWVVICVVVDKFIMSNLSATLCYSTWEQCIYVQLQIGSVMLNEAKTLTPRPELRLRGRGQFLEVEAKAEAKK